MTAPKPAPSKPLTFTPPQFHKGETQPSELPTVEPKKNKGHRPNVVIFDEAAESALDLAGTPKEIGKPSETVKKPFVLNPHLTQRPFHDDRLMQLKNRLQRPSFKNR